MSLFTSEEAQRISAAIADAEKGTSGEIVAVVTDQSSSYRHFPFILASIVALIVPWPLIHFTWWPVQWIFTVQLGVFLLLLALAWPESMRIMLVPRATRAANARLRAAEQFMTQNLYTTTGRTGVLLFVSVAERHVEVIADTGIDARVPKGTWQGIVDGLTADITAGKATDGFVRAIERIGVLLSEHFPPGTLDANELPNHLIVLTN